MQAEKEWEREREIVFIRWHCCYTNKELVRGRGSIAGGNTRKSDERAPRHKLSERVNTRRTNENDNDDEDVVCVWESWKWRKKEGGGGCGEQQQQQQQQQRTSDDDRKKRQGLRGIVSHFIYIYKIYILIVYLYIIIVSSNHWLCNIYIQK